MYHDPALSRAAAAADPRPRSAVSAGVGVAGLAGLVAWSAFARWAGMSGPLAALANLVACGGPMIAWSILVDRVHRAPGNGVDWTARRPFAQTIGVSLTKIVGLWLTWGAIASVYATVRLYAQPPFDFAMTVLGAAAPFVLAASVPWVMLTDRRLAEPRDGAWALGAWALNLAGPHDRAAIAGHLRSWAVKGFFLPFMLGVVPGGFAAFVEADTATLLADPVALAGWLITMMFMVDVAFATVGYLLTFRLLDAHIRSAQPRMSGWVAALICYPPFLLMGAGGPLNYHPGTKDWTHWLADHPVLLAGTGAVLVALTGIYAWATVAFGLRFSNLTHRGILTHGPYRFTRHPAYLSKNLFWWIATIPVLTVGTGADAVRATLLLAAVSGVYWWRARTEEAHLGADPAYRAYSGWIDRNAAIPRLLRRIAGVRS